MSRTKRIPPHRTEPSRHPIVHACASVLLAAGVLVLGILTASPDAHAEVHCDAHEANHFCAVTLAAAGFCDTATPTPRLLRRDAVHEILRTERSGFFWPVPAYWHPPAIGPPPARS